MAITIKLKGKTAKAIEVIKTSIQGNIIQRNIQKLLGISKEFDTDTLIIELKKIPSHMKEHLELSYLSMFKKQFEADNVQEDEYEVDIL